jgi:hypothetical protein
MRGNSLASTTRFLVFALAGLYGMAAVIVLLYAGLDAGQTVSWLVFLLGGAGVMLAGQLLAPAGWLSAILVSAGAVMGGLPLLVTIVVPIAVAAVIACSVALARAHSSAPAR